VNRAGAASPSPQQNAVDANLSLRNLRDGIFYTSDVNKAQPEGTGVSWRRWQIVRQGNARTPYWLIRVPPDIIDDHGGIWSPNSQALLAAIFRMNFPLRQTDEGLRPAMPQPVQLPKARDFNRLQSKEPREVSELLKGLSCNPLEASALVTKRGGRL
jgi:hypothetical protein